MIYFKEQKWKKKNINKESKTQILIRLRTYVAR